MTRNEFQTERLSKIYAYMRKADNEMIEFKNNKNKFGNAERRYYLCKSLLDEWNENGFWTDQNVLSYEMIYENQNDISAVSAF